MSPRQEKSPQERIVFSKSSPAPSRASPSTRSSRGLFSFNNPAGACPACDGLGVEQDAVRSRSWSCPTRLT